MKVTGGPTPDFVIRTAATGFGVSVFDLRGHSRARPLVQYRQVAMAAVKVMCGASFPETARHFDRDHTTVMHAKRRVEQDPRLSSTLDTLCHEVRKQWAVDHGAPIPEPVTA